LRVHQPVHLDVLVLGGDEGEILGGGVFGEERAAMPGVGREAFYFGRKLANIATAGGRGSAFRGGDRVLRGLWHGG
jgi:hypothetical protein